MLEGRPAVRWGLRLAVQDDAEDLIKAGSGPEG